MFSSLESAKNIVALIAATFSLVTAGLNIYLWVDTNRSSPDEIRSLQSSNLPDVKKKALIAFVRKGRALSRVMICALIVLGLALAAYLWFLPSDNDSWVAALKQRDPALFKDTGTYNIAKVYPSRAATYNESPLSTVIDGTKSSFDLVALSAGFTLEHFFVHLQTAMQRGVNIRIILIDHTEKNTIFDTFAQTIGESPLDLRGEIPKAIERIKQLKVKRGDDATGDITFKRYNGPLIFHGWFSDRNDPEHFIGQIGFYTYGGATHWSSILLGRDGQPMLRTMMQEYETLWKLAEPVSLE